MGLEPSGAGGCSVPCGLVKLAPSRARARGGQDVAPGAYWSLQQQNVALQTSRQALHAHPASACPPFPPTRSPQHFSPFLDVLPRGSSAYSRMVPPFPTHPPSSKAAPLPP